MQLWVSGIEDQYPLLWHMIHQHMIRCGNVVLLTDANRYSFAKLALDDYDQVQKQLAEEAKNETHISSLELASSISIPCNTTAVK